MGFKTDPIDFLDTIPENIVLKKKLLRKYKIQHEDNIDHPLWDLMMTDYVSQLYCLIQI
jgi:hypothetical protein